jgi:hypothetical protein
MHGGAAPISAGCDVTEGVESYIAPLEAFMKAIEQPSLEQLAQRKAALERKQRQRAREKARSHKSMVDHLEKLKGDRMNAEGIAHRVSRNQCMFGETAPGIDARTVEEALEVAREMARALTVSDVEEGESLLDFERRVFNAWVNFDKFVGRNDAGGDSPFAGGGHAPYLNRETGELSPGHGKNYWVDYCGGFEGCWRVLPGARNEIDLASLPKLKKLKMPEEPIPEAKPTPRLAPPPPIPQPQLNAINFAWIAPNAQRYLHGG